MDNISFKHSAVSGKTPTAEQLDYGEIAVNYNANHPFISIKDTNNEIQTVSTDKVNKDAYADKATTYSKDDVNDLISKIQGFDVEIVTELPESGDTHKIYFILKSSGETGDVYNEYMYVNSKWEKIGNTQIDLSAYYTSAQTNTAISGYTYPKADVYTKDEVNKGFLTLSGGTLTGNLTLPASGQLQFGGNAIVVDNNKIEQWDKGLDSPFDYSTVTKEVPTGSGSYFTLYNVYLKDGASANTVGSGYVRQICLGAKNTTGADGAKTIGNSNTVLASNATAIGNSNNIGNSDSVNYGSNSVAIGYKNSGVTGYAVLIGTENNAGYAYRSANTKVLIGRYNNTRTNSPFVIIGGGLSDYVTESDVDDIKVAVGQYNEEYTDFPYMPDGVTKSGEHSGRFVVGDGDEGNRRNIFKVGGVLYANNYANNYNGCWIRDNLKVEGGNLIVGDTVITEEQIKKLLTLI